jgi:hypothetical protein
MLWRTGRPGVLVLITITADQEIGVPGNGNNRLESLSYSGEENARVNF